jgi:peptidoglycan hydrolase-like protein with peptidoglycan-binding domain
LGLKPGKVDGTFDDDTRRAIRRYQSARNLDETGYLNEAFVVQILADSVRSIFR